MPTRLRTHDDRPEVTFRFNGRKLRGYEGEPVAAALMANGVEIFQRSLKLHNPRGVRCANGRCGQCMLTIDSRPNIRSCHEPLRAGMDVRTQRGTPSPRFDFGRALGAFTEHLPPGFQYRIFLRPRFMRPFFFGTVRRVSGYGAVDGNPAHPVAFSPPREVRDVDVLVVGGGYSGMLVAATVATSRAGSVVVLDDETQLGGTARFAFEPDPGHMIRCANETAEARTERQVVAFDNGVVAAATPTTIEKFRPRVLVIATGGYDFIPPFAGNDGPRIYGIGAALRILNGWGVLPASKTTVIGPTADDWAKRFADAGHNAVAEEFPRAPLRNEAVVFTYSIPTYELQHAAGVAMTVDENGAVVAQLGEGGVTSRPDVFVTGEAAGHCDGDEAASRGIATGKAVLRALAGEHIPWIDGRPAATAKPEPPVPGAMLCFCEDVTEEEFAHALKGDFPDIESAKRYTSLSMGLCQGKYCLHRARCITAYVNRTSLADTPMTVQRPPFVSVPLGVVAAQADEVAK